MSDWEITEDVWSRGERPPSEQRILVVDDDPSIRAMLGFVFEDEGYQVVEASDGVEAVAVLRDAPPEAMVLDLMMPRLDGHGVLRVRGEESLAAETRIVVLTAKTDPSDQVWCWELGADEFVAKPVDPEELLREVQAMLRRTPDEVQARRESGLAEARRLDALDAAFEAKRRRRR